LYTSENRIHCRAKGQIVVLDATLSINGGDGSRKQQSELKMQIDE